MVAPLKLNVRLSKCGPRNYKMSIASPKLKKR